VAVQKRGSAYFNLSARPGIPLRSGPISLYQKRSEMEIILAARWNVLSSTIS